MPARSAPVDLRLERASDAEPVRALLERAFAGTAEAVLVDRLRASREIVLGLVARSPHRGIAGYVAFPRLSVEHRGRWMPAIALAPLAVTAQARRCGVGSALVRRGLALLAEGGEQLVFVPGDPAYYARFGFDAAAAARFRSPYAGPYFMVRPLRPTAPVAGTVRYPSAFADLG